MKKGLKIGLITIGIVGAGIGAYLIIKRSKKKGTFGLGSGASQFEEPVSESGLTLDEAIAPGATQDIGELVNSMPVAVAYEKYVDYLNSGNTAAADAIIARMTPEQRSYCTEKRKIDQQRAEFQQKLANMTPEERAEHDAAVERIKSGRGFLGCESSM